MSSATSAPARISTKARDSMSPRPCATTSAWAARMCATGNLSKPAMSRPALGRNTATIIPLFSNRKARTSSSPTETTQKASAKIPRPLLGGAGFQILDIRKFQSRGMSRFESDFRGHPGIESLFPTTCAKAPAVTRLESRKLHVRPGRREVVALLERVFQKFLRHHRADGVNPRISWPSVAIAITEKPRHRFVAARLQIASQNISRHGPDRKCRHGLVPARKILAPDGNRSPPAGDF